MKKFLSILLIGLWVSILVGGVPDIPPVVYTKTASILQVIDKDNAAPIDSSTYSFDFFFYSGGTREIWNNAGYDPTVVGVWSLCMAFDKSRDSIYVWGKPLHVLPPPTLDPNAWSYRDTVECLNDSIPIFDNLTSQVGFHQDTSYYRNKINNALWDTPGVHKITVLDSVYCYPFKGSYLYPFGPCDGIRVYIMVVDTDTTKDTTNVLAWTHQQ